jgi:hypothetical protein
VSLSGVRVACELELTLRGVPQRRWFVAVLPLFERAQTKTVLRRLAYALIPSHHGTVELLADPDLAGPSLLLATQGLLAGGSARAVALSAACCFVAGFATLHGVRLAAADNGGAVGKVYGRALQPAQCVALWGYAALGHCLWLLLPPRAATAALISSALVLAVVLYRTVSVLRGTLWACVAGVLAFGVHFLLFPLASANVLR